MSSHAFERIKERLGEIYVNGKKIKNMSYEEIEEYVRSCITLNRLRVITKGIRKGKIVTKNFVAPFVVKNDYTYEITTIYNTKPKHINPGRKLTFRIGEKFGLKPG